MHNYLDLSKVLDSVDHNILLHQMLFYTMG